MAFFEINNSIQLKTNKIAGFDLDHTLICPKSNRTFPKDNDDWRFVNEEIPAHLLKINKQGYYIVIFTNQKGLKSSNDIINFKEKIANIEKKLGFGLHLDCQYTYFRPI